MLNTANCQLEFKSEERKMQNPEVFTLFTLSLPRGACRSANLIHTGSVKDLPSLQLFFNFSQFAQEKVNFAK